MKESGFILFIIVAIIIFSFWNIGSEESEIKKWIKNRGETVGNVEFRMVDVGPYIVPIKGFTYYYVKTDKNIYWFKFGWSNEIQQELPNGQYKEIKYGK